MTNITGNITGRDFIPAFFQFRGGAMKNFFIAVLIFVSICVFSNEIFSQATVVEQQDAASFSEYTSYLEISEKFAVIPGLKEGVVPQGLAYMEEKGWFVISSYRDNAGSILSFIDAQTGELIKSLSVHNEDDSVYTGHAGGVAISESNLWISSGGFIRRIPLHEIYTASDGEIIKIADKFNTGTNASFAAFHDGVLWVGEFFHDNNYLTDSARYVRVSIFEMNHSWVTGFKLDEETDLLAANRMTDGSEPVTPDYILSVPDLVQGIAFPGNGRVILSQSYGRNNDSTISIYDGIFLEAAKKTKEINGNNVPVFVLSSKNFFDKVKVFPMSENIVSKDGQLYVLYESAAEKYRSTGKCPTDYIWKMNLNQLK